MLREILNRVYLGNSVLDYVIALAILLIGVVIVRVFKIVALHRLKKLAQKTQTTFDDFLVLVIGKVALPLFYLASFYFALAALNLTAQVQGAVNKVFLAIVVFSIARFVDLLVIYGFTNYLKKYGQNIALEKSLNTTLKIIKLIIWALAIIFFMDNLGFKISAIIAGLGVGGIAIGLAAQAVLKDLFSYFSITFDRPFEVGDFIIVGDLLGTVEYIGAKTTRIRSLGGEQLIFSNTDLTDSRIKNYKRMEQRRVLFQFGIVYQTPYEKLQQIPGIVKNIIESVEDALFDRTHFSSYANSSLLFEVVYYVIGSDYNKYMDIQQEINLALFKEFESRAIEFAYPTQTLYINKSNA
ncbi:MAG: mechanosensitive ion channel family protein [Candidatus Kaelpia imicola]|nr:mechanosensitive ion channel family protein [Candidatus Kaelpia imicola]